MCGCRDFVLGATGMDGTHRTPGSPEPLTVQVKGSSGHREGAACGLVEGRISAAAQQPVPAIGRCIPAWTRPFLMGRAFLCLIPQHNACNPADLPSRDGRARARLASCLVEWLEWALGPLLIPQRLTVPAAGQRRKEGKTAALLSSLQAGGWLHPAQHSSTYV